MKRIFFMVPVFVVLLTAELVLAQDEFQPQIDVRSPLAGLQQFFSFDLPIFVHSITFNEQALAEDRINLVIEKELEQVSLLDEFNSGQVDASQFEDLNSGIVADISDQEVLINNMEASMPESVDDSTAKDVMEASSGIMSAEVSEGIQADVSSTDEISAVESGFADNSADSGISGGFGVSSDSGGEASLGAGDGGGGE